MASYTTRYLKRDEYDKWEELVSQSPAANVFDTTLWLDTLSSVLNSDIRILGVFNKEDLIGGVAFNVIKKFGMKIANIPSISFFNSCHCIQKETQHKGRQEKHILVITTLIAERLQREFHYAVIVNHPEFKDIRGFLWKDWGQNIVYSYRVCLNKVDLSLISSSKRSEIKKARKKLIIIEEVKDIVPVYDIIKQTYIRQNLKCPLTLDEMIGIYKKMSNNIVILAAKEPADEKCLATNISIIDYKRKYVYSLINAYDFKFADSGANSLLLWEAMESFRDKGFEFFDLGQAGGPSKSSFKSQFCADLVPYYQVSKSNSLKFSIAWRLTKGRII